MAIAAANKKWTWNHMEADILHGFVLRLREGVLEIYGDTKLEIGVHRQSLTRLAISKLFAWA